MIKKLFIQRTSYTKDILRGNMGVDHGHLKIPVLQQLLNRPNLMAIMPIIESVFNNKS